ncbi:15467_t:CDS:10 [Entrophospora sp. SA101]|nr:15467_t:CDS:10 [Entrophospora sp. SA101]
MTGRNVNIYFQEKTYNKIKPLIDQRKINEFVNQAVEKELESTTEEIIQADIKQTYSKEARTEITELDISNKNLEGSLVLDDFYNLTKFFYLTNCSQLVQILCYQNELTHLSNNCFPEKDLDIFTSFSELKKLRIAGMIKPSNFAGSLKTLRDLKKLEILDIRGTDISHGLEYLSDSVQEINCESYQPEAKVSDIYEELKPFDVSPLLPPQLVGKKEDKSTQFPDEFKKENELTVKEFDYNKLHFNHNLEFKNEVRGLAENSEEEIEEMNQEVAKMRQYYSNAEITLISMDSKIGDTRVLHQPSYIDDGKYLSHYEFNREKDKVEMTLTQALKEIKNRGRSIPVDGVYSILGLLPYGDQVKPKYKKFGESYSQTELEEALYEVMKVAIENEELSEQEKKEQQENGSTNIVGSVGKVSSIYRLVTNTGGKDMNLMTLTNQGLNFTRRMPHYTIYQEQSNNTHKKESSFEVEGGLYYREVTVQPPHDTKEEIKVSLLGTKETLAVAKAGNILVILHKEFFSTNKLFALLVEKTNQADVYRRLGLVELVNSEGIKVSAQIGKFNRKTIIGDNHKEIKSEPQFQTQIEKIEEGKHYGLGLVEISEGSEKLLQELEEKEIAIHRKPNVETDEEQKQLNELPDEEREELLSQIQTDIKDREKLNAQIESKNYSHYALTFKLIEENLQETRKDNIKIINMTKTNKQKQTPEHLNKVGLTLEESDLAAQLKEKDQNYPLEQRTNLKKLNISRKNLAGVLKLEGFDNLEELYCYSNKLTSLDCSNCPQLKIIRCQINKLTNLNLTNCSNITELYCNRNQLINLNFLTDLNSEKLETLLVANNNFSASDLTPFARFSNLKNLGLEDLDIAGTDVNDGLEHLPANVQIFFCSTSESPESKAELMAEELRNYGEPEKDDDGDENFVKPLQTWREFLNNEKYPQEERAEITYLDISKKNLTGALKLERFINLGTLNCSNNQLTNLNLSDCPNLAHLDCSNNQLHDLYFLKFLSKLEHLVMRNNSKLAQQSLKFLTSLTELEELNINNCPLEGSLKPLTNLGKLKELKISNTNFQEGLEHLPESCKELFCNSDYLHKSVKIVKELDKKDKDNLAELNKLKHPDEFINRASSVVGGSLVLVGAGDANSPYTQTGDTKNLLDNYHELFGILEKIEINKLGVVNRALNKLRDETKEFLQRYDKDENRTIDISELIEKRKEFGTDLNKEKQ